jgi:LuxR family maltose regulon positive regulatory protein
MTARLLESKMRVPARRRGQVARPRLVDRLDRAGESSLTLVSAPAGFGKTTLLTEWLARWLAAAPAAARAAAWLSVDTRDNDPAVFWSYVVATLDAAVPGVGGRAGALLRDQAPTEAVVDTLLSDLSAAPGEVALVLDDYHLLDTRAVLDGMAFLVAHLPPHVHLVVATRADPALPLARLRASGDLVEVRAADLRFTPDEAGAYLTGVMGLDLSAPQVAALEGRTEGWIAALQLAALSMQGRDDVARFVAGFAGDDRFVVDYLAEEVLQGQPDHVRSFLLQTSVLAALCGSLCDAVTGQGGGQATLSALDRANLFVVALDDRRQWYRYHHLFADVLQARLRDERPELVPALHRRASDWHEQAGDRGEAIRHAFAGGDVERAADLVELAIPAMRQARQEATLRRWLEWLPDEVLRLRPVLSVGHAGTLMVGGQVEGVEQRLRDAELCLAARAQGRPAPTGPVTVVDEAGLADLPCIVAVYRAGQARVRGDVAGTIAHAHRALDLVRAGDHLGRGAAAGLLALASWSRGDLDAADRWYADAMAQLVSAGHRCDVLGCALALADIRVARGRLTAATTTFQQALLGAEASGAPFPRGTADMHVGLAELWYERDDLAAARRHLHASAELGEHAGLPQHRYRWRVVAARLRAAAGDAQGAVDLLDEAERVFTSDFSPEVRPVAAIRARLQVAHGRWADALAWARERGLSARDDVTYLREYEHLTLARALLARHAAEPAEVSLDDVSELLARLLAAAEHGQRGGSVVEVLVLQALALRQGGDVPAAVATLRRAVTLAEPEGYVRVVTDEGPAALALLRALAQHGAGPSHLRRLLAAGSPAGPATPAPPLGLVEPLTAREQDVLQLLATELDGPDIARQLVVSLNTVRTHTKNVYAKLGVTNRRAAVRRAHELDLLSRRAR